jgi:hypothetical protein
MVSLLQQATGFHLLYRRNLGFWSQDYHEAFKPRRSAEVAAAWIQDQDCQVRDQELSKRDKLTLSVLGDH